MIDYIPMILVLAFILFFIIIPVTQFLKRRRFIEAYTWPPGLLDKLARHHPHLTAPDCERVGEGLKQFFLAYLMSGFRPVGMPSQVADDLWHEMILYTRHYQRFCDGAFGRFLHHTPAIVLRPEEKADNAGLRRVWWQTCSFEGIDPRNPARLPLLFALDGDLNIEGGFRYHSDCASLKRDTGAASYCGGDMGSTEIDGSTDGFGDGGGDGGDGGGCGGGGD